MRINCGRRRPSKIFGFGAALLAAIAATGCGSSNSPALSQQQQAQQLQPAVSQIKPSADSSGTLQSFSTTGGVDFSNDFFDSLGTNGRRCFSCHQPSDGWTITPSHLQARFNSTAGSDPIFRPVDGADCPSDDVSTLTARQAAYSLLLSRGVIRISRPIPADAEFSLSPSVPVVDPYNCVASNGLSLYRRPLPATNLKFETTIMWDGRETIPGFDLFHDLESQANDATITHAQSSNGLTSPEQREIVQFESALFTAQIVDSLAGDLTQNGTNTPQKLASRQFTAGENNFLAGGSFDPNVFTLYQNWENLTGTDSVSQRRASIARGEKIFNTRVMNIFGVPGFNDVLNPNALPVSGSCSTCHSTPDVGALSTNNLMNIGTADLNQRLAASLPTADMPIYTFACTSGPYNGAQFQVTDPGLALSTGKCLDIGKFKVPGLRGLAARAPYFHDGSAATLMDVVNFYNSRFVMRLTDQEKADLVAFLQSL